MSHVAPPPSRGFGGTHTGARFCSRELVDLDHPIVPPLGRPLGGIPRRLLPISPPPLHVSLSPLDTRPRARTSPHPVWGYRPMPPAPPHVTPENRFRHGQREDDLIPLSSSSPNLFMLSHGHFSLPQQTSCRGRKRRKDRWRFGSSCLVVVQNFRAQVTKRSPHPSPGADRGRKKDIRGRMSAASPPR